MIYRFKALAKRRDPDCLDAPLALASPGGWVVTFVIGFCLLALVGWGFLGRINQHVSAPGVLQYPGGLASVRSTSPGVVTALSALGSTVSESEYVAMIRVSDEPSLEIPILAVSGGRVVQHLVNVGDFVDVGSSLVVIEPGAIDGAALEAVVQVDANEIASIRVGQEVRLTVAGVATAKYGLLQGVVTEIAPFPSGTDGISVGPTTVVVSLSRADTVSGYEWTSLQGPERQLDSQTPVSAEIDIGAVAPLALLRG